MRSPNRKHERSSFFKYMPASTAIKVLKSCSLRWSSPVLFNDPFDVPRDLAIVIEPGLIADAALQVFSELIQNPPDDTSHLSPKLRLIVETVKGGISSEAKAELLREIQIGDVPSLRSGTAIEELRKEWRALVPEFRILCLTESPTHAAMWFHYADRYKGSVLEFRCIDELDSAWLSAKKVDYPPEKPEVYTAMGWAELLMLPADQATEQVLHTSTYTKAPDWSYENEWRLVTYERPNSSEHFSDYRFNPEEVASIYLGPHAESTDREELIQLASCYPNTKVFEVSIGVSREFNIRTIRG